MSNSSWLLSIGATVKPEEETAFNDWYDEVHLPAVLAVPGFHSVRRFVSDGPNGRRYLTEYDIAGPEVLGSEEFKSAAQRTPFAGDASFEMTLYRPLKA